MEWDTAKQHPPNRLIQLFISAIDSSDYNRIIDELNLYALRFNPNYPYQDERPDQSLSTALKECCSTIAPVLSSPFIHYIIEKVLGRKAKVILNSWNFSSFTWSKEKNQEMSRSSLCGLWLASHHWPFISKINWTQLLPYFGGPTVGRRPCQYGI